MPEKERKQEGKGISYDEIAAFCEQAAMLIRAGVSTAQSIETMVEDMPDGRLKAVYKQVARQVSETGVLSSGLTVAGVFPEYMVRMVKVGEKAGRLDDTLESLAVHYDRMQTFQDQIRSAVLYPMILIGIMAGVIFVLLNNVMPVFRQVFFATGQRRSGRGGRRDGF